MQQFDTTIRVEATTADNAKKKIAVLNNLLQNISETDFVKVFEKLQTNPKALANLSNFINFL